MSEGVMFSPCRNTTLRWWWEVV